MNMQAHTSSWLTDELGVFLTALQQRCRAVRKINI